ncbi:MAG TPA: PAS domain S-box protein, partial [Opitutus sp.]|nr:PAS domain S-box protein [Opitutus sp.]
ARLLGVSETSIQKRRLAEFVAAGSQDALYAFRRQLFGTRAPRTRELALASRTGRPRADTIAVDGVRLPVRAGGRVSGLCAVRDISGSVRATEQLRETQAQFARIAGSVGDAILSLDDRRRIELVNPAAERMFGGEAGRLIGRRLETLLPVRFRTALRAQLEDLRRQSGPAAVRLDAKTGRRIDGAEFPIEATIACATLGDRRRCTVVVRELSAPEQVMQQLRARLAAIEASSTHAIVSIDLDGRIESWNHGAEQLYGYAASEIVGRPMSVLLFPEDRDSWREMVERIQTGSPVPPFHAARRHQRGHRLIVSSSVTPIRDATQKLTGLVCLCHDVTAQLQMEVSLREREQALTDFFDDAPLGLAWVDPAGSVIRVNRAQGAMLGRPEAELLGGRFSDWFVQPDIAQPLLQEIAAHRTVHNVRVHLRTRDGGRVHALADGNGFWRDDLLLYSRWFVRDVTQRVDLERRILRAVENEQRRFGNDLHDDLCQQLSGLEFTCMTLSRDRQAVTPAGEARLQQLAGQLRH